MHKELVRLRDIDLRLEDHGILIIGGTVEYESGGASGFPDFCFDTSFLYRLFTALNVHSLRELNGLSCFFLYEEKPPHCGMSVTEELIGFAPLHAKDGKPFLLADWRAWLKRRFPNGSPSPYELRTGKDPR